jgi:hypothetical protein
VEIYLEPCDDFSWAHGVRDPVVGQEHVQPKYTGLHHFDNHPGWHLLVQKHGVDASRAFLHRADVSLDLGDVFFVVRHDVHLHPEIKKVSPHGLKLVVGMPHGYAEASLRVYCDHLLDGVHDGGVLAVL